MSNYAFRGNNETPTEVVAAITRRIETILHETRPLGIEPINLTGFLLAAVGGLVTQHELLTMRNDVCGIYSR